MYGTFITLIFYCLNFYIFFSLKNINSFLTLPERSRKLVLSPLKSNHKIEKFNILHIYQKTVCC